MKISTSIYIAFLLSIFGFRTNAAESPSLHDAARANDRATVRALLKQGADLQARDPMGNTPLIVAAFYADAGIVEDLLKAGADVNAANKPGATALMRAATFPEKAKLIALHDANVKARSALGNDALILAARQRGSLSLLKLLLDRGADMNGTNIFGATPLMAAVASGDLASVNLLLDRGANINARPNMDQDGFIMGGGRTPLMWAAYQGDAAMIKLLLKRGAKVNESVVVGSALTQAAWSGQIAAAKLLLEAGADVNQRDLIANYTPLHWAASSENSDPALVELLLSHGADANAEGGQPIDNFLGATQTPLSLARKRGHTPIFQALLKAGAKDQAAPETDKHADQIKLAGARTIPEAVRKALPPLVKTAESSAETFQRHASKQQCISCHQQQLPLAAINLAASQNFAVDPQVHRHQLELLNRMVTRFLQPASESTFLPENAIFAGYAALDLHLEKQTPSLLTDALAHAVATSQFADGHWSRNMPRPPIQASDIGATALGIYTLKTFPISARRAELEKQVDHARHWLASAKAETTDERTHQILGLAWAGESPAALTKYANDLIAKQRPDGGWASLPALESDAFATGQTLYALREGAKVSLSNPAIQRGVEFLLRTQAADGTWHVRRRAHPFQPPMESSFPYGADGWISAAASSWAVMGLVSSMNPETAITPAAQLAGHSTADAKIAASPADNARTVASASRVDFARDIQPIFERSCVACHSGERPKGGLKLSDRASLLHGGNRGEPAVIAGNSSRSALVRFVSDQVEDLEMPPLSQRKKFPGLTADEITRLNAWVEQGAAWPDNIVLKRHN
jgi:ankyrin repeat protein